VADHYRVEPGALRSAASGFDGVASHLETAGQTLGAALDGEGHCWGGDEAGQQFEGKYLGPATSTRQAFGQYADVLRTVLQKLDQMAATYTTVDDGWARGFGKGG
jgi:uncharacterized protein YukE